MRLTLHTDYALRVLLYLSARREKLVTIREIARSYKISEAHLTKVVHRLGTRGFVETVRGRNGGIRLGRDDRAIVLGDVVRATEPDFQLVECFNPEANQCPILVDCRLSGVLQNARDAFLASLDRHTLADLDPQSIRFPTAPN